jgi:hypothetical protein
MTIIDNHKSVKIDQTFKDRHSEMFKFFNDRNLDVEVSDDFKGLKTFLTSLQKEDYPYTYDGYFDPDIQIDLDTNAFVLYLKQGDNVISTYAAKSLNFHTFYDRFINHFNIEYNDETLTLTQPLTSSGIHMYSSCQWVSKEHRENGFGTILDHLKKNICFDILNATSNYAIHKETFINYHLNRLSYDVSVNLATIPQGNVGGAGDSEDKVYNICWIKKDPWLYKLDDVKKLYI